MFFHCVSLLRAKSAHAMTRNIHGFSLIELILGMMIVSLLGLGLFSSFTNGLRLNREIESAGRLTRELRWVFDGISRDLENARFYDFSQSFAKQTSFVGERNRIQFLMVTKDGLKWVSYFIGEPKRTVVHKTIIGKRSSKNTTITTRVTQEARKFLIREEVAFTDEINEQKDQDSNQEIILSNVREDALGFEFGSAEGSISWQDSWQSADLPSFVKMKLRLENASNKSNQETEISRQLFLPMGEMGRENEQETN